MQFILNLKETNTKIFCEHQNFDMSRIFFPHFTPGLAIFLLCFSIVHCWRDVRTDIDKIDARSIKNSLDVLRRRETRAGNKIISKDYSSGAFVPDTSEESSSESESEPNCDVSKLKLKPKPKPKPKVEKIKIKSKSSSESESSEEKPSTHPIEYQNAMTGGGDFKKAALQFTNYLRDEHGAPALKVDPKLEKQAQAHANYLAKTNKAEHSCKTTSCSYGENFGSSGDSDRAKAIRGVIERWYDEGKLYDYSKPEFNIKTGHFTQLVWKGTTRVGFGMALNAKTGKLIVVAEYAPPGNVKGKFKENVLPLAGAVKSHASKPMLTKLLS